MPRPVDGSGIPHHCQSCAKGPPDRLINRRTLLKSFFGMSFSFPLAGLLMGATEDPKRARPQIGDILVFSSGDRQGQPLVASDVPLGGPPVTAYPLEPKTQTVRDGSRLNRILLVRLEQDSLSDQTRSDAADGIVGYSAVCTHTGCDVAGWNNTSKWLLCPCHASTFDPKDHARVTGGPAPRPLAALPLRLESDKIIVAGSFSGRVGAIQK